MYNEITRYNSPNYTPANSSRAVFGHDRVISGITIHHWGDPALAPKFDSVVDYLCRPNGDTSAHAVVEANKVAWIVDDKDVAWHTGSPLGNASTIGLELNPRASEADYKTSAELIGQLRYIYGDVMLYAHNYWTNTQCPGAWDVYRLDKMSYYYLAQLNHKGPQPFTVTVGRGDTLFSIGKKYNRTVAKIMSDNGIKDPTKLRIGQVLKMN